MLILVREKRPVERPRGHVAMSKSLDKRVYAFLCLDSAETRGRFVIEFGQLGGRRRRVSAHRFYFAALDALERQAALGIPTRDEFLESNMAKAPWLAAASAGEG